MSHWGKATGRRPLVGNKTTGSCVPMVLLVAAFGKSDKVERQASKAGAGDLWSGIRPLCEPVPSEVLFRGVSLFDDFPVDDLPEGREMGGTSILVIQIIRMFPDIKGQQRLQALHHGIRSSRLLCDDQVAVSIRRQPHPARAKEPYAFGFEFCLKSLKAPPLLLNLRPHT